MRAVLVGPNSHRSCLEELKTTYRLETVAHFLEPAAALAFVRAGAEAPAVMVADVSGLHDPGADRALVELLDATAARWPGCRVAAVLSEAQSYLWDELQHAQARTFGPGQVDDLAAYLALARRREAQARVVLALSAKGGVGKTSLIANLGTALAVRHGLRVAAVDGDLTRGDLARLLGVEPTTTVLDLVADRSPGGIRAALDRYLVPLCDGRLALLPAPGGALGGGQPWTALTTRHAQAVLAALGERFDVVLLDTPPDLQRSSPFPAAVLRSAEAVPAGGKGLPFVGLVVVQPQPMERWGARQVLDFVTAYGADHGLVRGVLVHRNPATGNARQLERLLGVEIVEAIPYDPKAAAAHYATELVYAFDKKRLSPPARAYDRLAQWIAEGGVGA
jgi:MinD-like ATPase involved in chromosome partitioning or flagellar assembly